MRSNGTETAALASCAEPGLVRAIRAAIERAGGWIGFDRFMAMALYEPGLGYYSRSDRMFGTMPASGSDFVTAPELSPMFGRALARQLGQALGGTRTAELWEFGAGSGALAAQVLDALDAPEAPLDPGTHRLPDARCPTGAPGAVRVERYTIVELSAALRACQRERLARFGDRVRWLDAWPDAIEGVVLGNELLDAMPVTLIASDGARWHERGVAIDGDGFVWEERTTALRPPVEALFPAGTVTELHRQAEAFIASLAERLLRGAAFFIDYGFPAAEYYHPQRTGGTLMAHRAHRADTDPLVDVGAKDLTAHVDFTGIALAGQSAGLDVLGYTTQAHFLINCGIGAMLAEAPLPERVRARTLLIEHEMGELFKVIGFAKGADPAFARAPLGFAVGDRMHRL